MSALLDSDISSVQRVRDVSSVFTLARAVENPVSTMCRKGPKPRSTLFEFPFKQRITPSDSAVADGVDVTDADLTNNEANKCMNQSRLQKGRVAIGVSDLANEFGDEYAASNLMADNLSDAIIAARENLEVTVLKLGDSQAYGGTTTPAKTRGIGSWIRSANPAGTPDLPINSLALTPTGNINSNVSDVTTLKDTDFNAVMKSIATAARMKGTWDVFLSADATAVVDAWSRMGEVTSTSTQLRRFNTEMADGTITMEIRFYVTSFGKLRFHTHYSLPAGVHCYIINMDHFTLRPGYAPRTRELPYLGGSWKRIIEYVYGTQCDNPRAHGKITNGV
jgi:Family of unknown function (DUF5309)